ncbi:MAG TPA: family 65 glycosyl hydrolase, partial [Candidatus Limiplasma sp.]|nr:family 65 glycosyl hydrolase [Candidatus Limiplasma sp.]
MTQTWARENFAHLETLYHNANGYLGVRAAPEEGPATGVDSIRGTYLNAFYELKDVRYGEKLYGFPETQQVMVNLPDAQTVVLEAEGQLYSMFGGDVQSREQTLDMAAGRTCRTSLWHTAKGDLRITVLRMVSFMHKGLFLLRYRVASEGFAGAVRLTACLNADVRNHAGTNDPRVAAEPLRCLAVDTVGWDGDIAVATAHTLRSGLSMGCRVAHDCPFPATHTANDAMAEATFVGMLQPGQSVELIQYAYYADSRRDANPSDAAAKGLAACRSLGADLLEAQQAECLASFWRASRVEIPGDIHLQQAMDYNLYELYQSTGTDGVSNVAAKGLSGEGYEGHTFWDSEIYVMPLFLWTQPAMARQMMLYRCALLERARANARSLGFSGGALYPWRTIDGDECSAYFPAGTAQYHIDGDIAYAFLQYLYATDDWAFMAEHGAEALVEIARFWLELGHMGEGGFRIECVTGPDEYTCLVDN